MSQTIQSDPLFLALPASPPGHTHVEPLILPTSAQQIPPTLAKIHINDKYTDIVSKIQCAGRRLFDICAISEIDDKAIAELAALIMEIESFVELLSGLDGSLRWNTLEDPVIYESDPEVKRKKTARARTVLDDHFEDVLRAFWQAWQLYFIDETRLQGLYGMKMAITDLRNAWKGLVGTLGNLPAEKSVSDAAADFDERWPRPALSDYVSCDSLTSHRALVRQMKDKTKTETWLNSPDKPWTGRPPTRTSIEMTPSDGKSRSDIVADDDWWNYAVRNRLVPSEFCSGSISTRDTPGS